MINPEEKNKKLSRRFVELSSFVSMWNSLGLTSEDLLEFETMLIQDPKQSRAKRIEKSGGHPEDAL